MKETMKKFLKHRSLQCFAALSMVVTSALASACTTVVRDGNGEVVTVVDHTKTYMDYTLKAGRLVLVEVPTAAAGAAREAAPLVSAIGGVVEVAENAKVQKKWVKAVEKNNAQYWQYQNKALKANQPKPQPKPQQKPQKVKTTSTTGNSGNVQTIIVKGKVIQYQ